LSDENINSRTIVVKSSIIYLPKVMSDIIQSKFETSIKEILRTGKFVLEHVVIRFKIRLLFNFESLKTTNVRTYSYCYSSVCQFSIAFAIYHEVVLYLKYCKIEDLQKLN
jgi:hypothetical protein